MKTLSNTTQKGFITIPVLGYVFVITILSTAFLGALNISLDKRQQVIRDAKAYTLAESGFHYAVVQLTENPDYSGVQTISVDNNHINLSIRKISNSPIWMIRSRGLIGDVRFPLHTVVLEAQLTKTASGWSVQPATRLRPNQWKEGMGL